MINEIEKHIATELKKFSLTDAAIEQMEKEFLPLVVKGVEDKDGYKAVREARLTVKEHRVKVEKTRKELKADSLAFGKAVDGEAKRITTKLESIETHLQEQEDIVAKEFERRKAEEEALARAQELQDMGMNEAAEEAISQPVVIEKVTVAEPVKAGGESFREIWKAEVVDLMALVKAVAEGRQPLAYLEANTVTLGKAAAMFKGTVPIPGVKITSETIIARRTA